ncbi:MAG: DUF4974 domain-containing protein [Prolixibacteraceae bacterium]|nr:DUF4974 domain-containing protein [Prolixibacteraceae bacterium]
MRKVEDILGEENISLEKLQNESVSREDVVVATQIYSYLKTPKDRLDLSEKSELRIRIENSVKKVNQRKASRLWFACASVFIFAVCGGTWYFQVSHSSEITAFANSLNGVERDTTTRLVLNSGREILIPATEANIHYDEGGEKIIIDSDREVRQKIETSSSVYNTVIVPYGKRVQISLPEGTKVWLNSGSKLIYPAVFASTLREVYIDGEGVFEVTKDPEKPFVVKSCGFDVEVIGTIFNVSAYSDDKYSYAVLEEGSIRLKQKTKFYQSAGEHMLLPGEMAVLAPEQKDFNIKRVDPADYLSWRDGYYVFKSEQLENILKKLSRYYSVDIVLENSDLFHDTFSGSLYLKNSPEEVLDIIKKTTQFKYRKEGGDRIIVY